MEKVKYGGRPNCIRLETEEIELVATTDVGPRIIRLAFNGGDNLFKEFPEQLGKTSGDEWLPFGGHRFWHAPEAAPRTYYPDFDPVEAERTDGAVRLTQPVESTTGMQKELEISLAEDENRITLLHRLTNRNLWTVTAAPWAITVMAEGGRAVFPHEPYRPHPEYLLPARPIVVWHYTDMSDERWTWGRKYIQLRQDPDAETKNKAGILNRRGWAAYLLGENVFVKRFAHVEGGHYPDFGCNCECYTDPEMIEIESLGPLETIEPGASVEHVEDWYLFREEIGESEKELDDKLLPLVEKKPG